MSAMVIKYVLAFYGLARTRADEIFVCSRRREASFLRFWRATCATFSRIWID